MGLGEIGILEPRYPISTPPSRNQERRGYILSGIGAPRGPLLLSLVRRCLVVAFGFSGFTGPEAKCEPFFFRKVDPDRFSRQRALMILFLILN